MNGIMLGASEEDTDGFDDGSMLQAWYTWYKDVG